MRGQRIVSMYLGVLGFAGLMALTAPLHADPISFSDEDSTSTASAAVTGATGASNDMEIPSLPFTSPVSAPYSALNSVTEMATLTPTFSTTGFNAVTSFSNIDAAHAANTDEAMYFTANPGATYSISGNYNPVEAADVELVDKTTSSTLFQFTYNSEAELNLPATLSSLFTEQQPSGPTEYNYGSLTGELNSGDLYEFHSHISVPSGGGDPDTVDIAFASVPEPTTAGLMSLSLFALLRRRPRNKMSPECAAV
ncbi:MAG: PEP-CTERM sorting domain-containing protein [Tepidisphaeraceae bacterium]|jgi:hypothetical protein